MTKCSIIARSTMPEAMCDCCDIGPPLDDRQERGGASLWLAHILDLKMMIESGCQFGPNDLTWEEWEALKLIRVEQSIREAAAYKETEERRKYTTTFGAS